MPQAVTVFSVMLRWVFFSVFWWLSSTLCSQMRPLLKMESPSFFPTSDGLPSPVPCSPLRYRSSPLDPQTFCTSGKRRASWSMPSRVNRTSLLHSVETTEARRGLQVVFIPKHFQQSHRNVNY